MGFLLGMGQMLVEGGKPQANLARAMKMAAAAANRGCHIIVLPECLDLGWTHGSARTEAQPIPGPHTALLSRTAGEHAIYIAAGLVERSNDRIYNAAVLIGPDGQLLLHHRKINELDFARDLYSRGDRLGVVQTEIGVIGLNICADNFVESLAIGHTLGMMGAQLLLSPCAWAVSADHDNSHDPYGDFWRRPYRQLAHAHGMTVIGVSNVGWITDGQWSGRKCIGCSLAVGADGKDIAQGPYGADAEKLIVIEV